MGRVEESNGGKWGQVQLNNNQRSYKKLGGNPIILEMVKYTKPNKIIK